MWATYQEHVGTVQALLTDKRVDAMLKNKVSSTHSALRAKVERV